MKTKAVTNKKTYDNYLQYGLVGEESPNTILGVWITNHKYKGIKNENNLHLEGSFEINVWYSYDDNNKTNVKTRIVTYNENILSIFNEKSYFGIKVLGEPICHETYIEDGKIIVEVFKQFEIEVIDEIEILEETSEKIDKLSYQQIGNWHLEQHDYVEFTRAIDKQIQQMGNKINELIDKVNYLLEKENK